MQTPNLTDEQRKKIKSMVKLSKVCRVVFLSLVVVGAIVSLVGSLVGGTTGTFLLYVSFLLFMIAVLFAIVLFVNLQRVKTYCKSIGITFR